MSMHRRPTWTELCEREPRLVEFRARVLALPAPGRFIAPHEWAIYSAFKRELERIVGVHRNRPDPLATAEAYEVAHAETLGRRF